MDFGCSHHMANDASLLSSLNEAKEEKIFVVDDYAVTISGSGSVVINGVYHILQLSANLLFIPQITEIGKKVEIWPNKL
jgi:hypothetical protein